MRLGLMRAILSILGAGLVCGTALAAAPPDVAMPSGPPPAPTPPVAAPLDAVGGGALAALFVDLCVKSFPDGAALEAQIAAKGAAPMSAVLLKSILHDDPGRGWVLKQDNRLFLITEELPPFHACSVRLNTPAGVPITLMGGIITDVIARSGQKTLAPRNLNQQSNSQMLIHAVEVGLTPPPAGADAENFMAFVTTYRDTQTGAVRFVENRFVRQVHAAAAP
jgi:hypothetical protein